MINIILPIIDKFEEYEKMLEYLSKKRDIKVYIGADEKFKDKNFDKKFVVKFFRSKSQKEEVINSLHSIEKKRGGTMVVRRPLSEREFEELISREEDIVTLNKSQSSFTRGWKNFWRKVITRFFAFYYFEDISTVYFKENMFELVTSLTNLSYISRINRFVGLSFGVVETTEKSVKKDFDRFTTAVNFLSFFLFLVICVMCSVILCTTLGNTVVYVLLAFTITLIGFVFFLISILNLARTVSVGQLRFGKAEEIF